MSPLVIIYSEHAVTQMRKARITRQVVRRVIQQGARAREFVRVKQEHWHAVLRIENVTYRVQWIQGAGYVKIVTAYIVGRYD